VFEAVWKLSKDAMELETLTSTCPEGIALIHGRIKVVECDRAVFPATN